ncbi:MAG: YgcG family protein, partial [Comamonadaceae bacterium]
MVTARIWRALAAVFLIAMACTGAWAQGVLPVPALTARVIDQTGTLDAAQREGLESTLADFEQKKGSQIVVLMVPTTEPEDIASYANRVANDWKIGRKDVGDGILVIVAKNDRKMRIEVAKTLEGAVPDLAAARIIDEQMKPRFRQNDFAGGIGGAVEQLIARVNGEALPEVTQVDIDGERGGLLGNMGIDWGELGIFLFIGVLVVGRIARGILGNKLGPLATGIGAGVVAMVITSSIVLAVIAAVVALIFTLFSGAIPLPIGGGGGRGGGYGGGGGFGGGFGGGSSSGGGGFS